MQKISITLRSISDIRKFVNEVTLLDYEVDLEQGRYIVDAKSILGVYGLDMTKVLTVTYNGYNPEFESYLSHLAIAC